eukprot:27330-Eustigmatos_ZCMA.PRE.1
MAAGMTSSSSRHVPAGDSTQQGIAGQSSTHSLPEVRTLLGQALQLAHVYYGVQPIVSQEPT